jgi:hypothetical protein
MYYLEEIKKTHFRVFEQDLSFLSFNPKVDNVLFDLPDKSTIEISREIHDIPEMIFS